MITKEVSQKPAAEVPLASQVLSDSEEKVTIMQAPSLHENVLQTDMSMFDEDDVSKPVVKKGRRAGKRGKSGRHSRVFVVCCTSEVKSN